MKSNDKTPPAAGQAAHTQEVSGLFTPYALGLETNEETAQIINAQGWHVAAVAIDPAIQTAAFIVRACNSHAALLAALKCAEAVLDSHVNDSGSSEMCSFAEALETARAALQSAKE